MYCLSWMLLDHCWIIDLINMNLNVVSWGSLFVTALELAAFPASKQDVQKGVQENDTVPSEEAWQNFAKHMHQPGILFMNSSTRTVDLDLV